MGFAVKPAEGKAKKKLGKPVVVEKSGSVRAGPSGSAPRSGELYEGEGGSGTGRVYGGQDTALGRAVGQRRSSALVQGIILCCRLRARACCSSSQRAAG